MILPTSAEIEAARAVATTKGAPELALAEFPALDLAFILRRPSADEWSKAIDATLTTDSAAHAYNATLDFTVWPARAEVAAAVQRYPALPAEIFNHIEALAGDDGPPLRVPFTASLSADLLAELGISAETANDLLKAHPAAGELVLTRYTKLASSTYPNGPSLIFARQPRALYDNMEGRRTDATTAGAGVRAAVLLPVTEAAVWPSRPEVETLFERWPAIPTASAWAILRKLAGVGAKATRKSV